MEFRHCPPHCAHAPPPCQDQYYPGMESTYHHCKLHNVCIMGASKQASLIYVGSPGASALPRVFSACPNNYRNAAWCTLQARTVSCSELGWLAQGPRKRRRPVRIVREPTYLTGRWKHGNVVENTFEVCGDGWGRLGEPDAQPTRGDKGQGNATSGSERQTTGPPHDCSSTGAGGA